MKELFLIVYSRKGCCLCEGLEKRLRELAFDRFNPHIRLRIVDIDQEDIPVNVRARYDLEVPVMILGSLDRRILAELPRVSPRLNGDGLFEWMQRAITKAIGSDL